MRMLEAVWIGRVVIVRAHSLGDSPIGHRKFRIEFACVLKRARGFVVVERIDEAQSLIEEFLCLRVLGGNGMMKVAQAVYQRDGMNLRMRSVVLGRCGRAEQSNAQHVCQSFHEHNPPKFSF